MIFLPDFFAEIRKIELDMKDLVQRAQGAGYGAGSSYANLVPPLDIYERNGYLVVVMDVPGIPAENLEVGFSHGFLIVGGRKEPPIYEEKHNFVCLERNFGTFQRKVAIQRPLDFSDIHGELQDGTLTIWLKLRDERRGGPISIPIEEKESESVELNWETTIRVKEEE